MRHRSPNYRKRRGRKTPPRKHYKLQTAQCMRGKAREARRKKISQNVLRAIDDAASRGNTRVYIKSYLTSEEIKILAEDEGYRVKRFNSSDIFSFEISWKKKNNWW